MTSSLVGSEMCIRDSVNTAVQRFGQRNRKLLFKQKPNQFYLTRLSRTVSYTHLTLPTICSV
eukprot:10025690-Prorocentrum_lima.AAC.1